MFLTCLSQLLYASGFLFMGATEEQMVLVANSGLDHVSYILILYSFAFLVFLFANMLIHLFDRNSNVDGKVNLDAPVANGRAENRQVRDAEEFELEGLMSDDEDDAQKGLREDTDDDQGLGSPSTVGKNSDRVAR